MLTRSTTLFEALRQTAAEFGDDRGIRYFASLEFEEYRGFAALDLRARAIAEALAGQGHTPGGRAVIAMTPGLLWADAVYGILYAGLSFVPTANGGFDSGAAIAGRVADIVRASEASTVLVDRKMLTKLGDESHLLGVPLLIIEDLLAAGDAEAWTAPDLSGDAPASMFFTSGSTGDPKGVVSTHRGLLATAEAAGELLQADRDSTLVGWLPLHHAMGLIMQLVVPAINGGQSVLTTTEQFQRRPMSWLQLISDHRATLTLAGNFAFALCTQFATDEQVAGLDLSSMKYFVSGSEPVRPETVAAFVERFAPSGLSATAIAPAFGMTEAMFISTKPAGAIYRTLAVDSGKLEHGWIEPSSAGDAVELISCGVAASHTTLAIVDPDTLVALPESQVGEIWISSPSVSPGYFRRPDATAETFGFTLRGDDRSYMRSGDLGAIVDGELFVTGRLKDVIILRGRNIYPQDIEAAAAALSPALGIGAAFELEGHSAPVGVVVEYDPEAAGSDAEATGQLLVRMSRELVDRFSLPSVAIALAAAGSVPRTPTGKVRRKPARGMLESGNIPLVDSIGFDAA